MSKPNTNDRIESILSAWESQRAAHIKKQSERSEANALLKELDAKIVSIGEPDWRDPKKLDALASLKRQREACESAINGMDAFDQQREKNSDVFVRDGFDALRRLLHAAEEGLLAKITKQFGPYFVSTAGARKAAEKSDAALSARFFIENLSNVTSNDIFRTHDGLHSATEEIEVLLKEALQPEPDLEKFFRPYRDFTGA